MFSLKVPDPFRREPNPSVASQRDVEEEKGAARSPAQLLLGSPPPRRRWRY
jgi:hypothetical protein